MRFLNMKQIVTAICGGFLVAQASVGLAHDQTGSFTTGLAAAVDFYTVTCFDDGNGAPARLEAQVRDTTASTSKVHILIHKGTSCTTNKCAQASFDATDNNTTYSPLVSVSQGAGTYNLYVMHSATGTDSYTASFHCKTAGNVHTGTSVTSRQQQ